MINFISRPTKHEKWNYCCSILAIVAWVAFYLYSGFNKSMNANLFFGGVLLFLLRPLYRSFETMFLRELTLIDNETLRLKTGWYTFTIDRERCLIDIRNAPIMVYGPSSLDMGFNICIVRNDSLFINRIFKNKITLVHRETLEEAETVMKELKELFDIKDFWDVQRIKYESRQNKNH